MKIYIRKNMGNLDIWIRTVLACLFVLLWFQNIVTGTAGTVLLVLSAIFLLTSILGFCPVYRLFGINTFSRK